MEWLTHPVQVWQMLVLAVSFLAMVGFILSGNLVDMRRQIERNDTERYKVERYIHELLSKARDDINSVDLRTYDLEMQAKRLEIQAKRLQTPLWKRWLRKIAA